MRRAMLQSDMQKEMERDETSRNLFYRTCTCLGGRDDDDDDDDEIWVPRSL